ncbi:MAG: hypothetical protein ACJ8CR_24730 [Roseiflexaceae bacterium]
MIGGVDEAVMRESDRGAECAAWPRFNPQHDAMQRDTGGEGAGVGGNRELDEGKQSLPTPNCDNSIPAALCERIVRSNNVEGPESMVLSPALYSLNRPCAGHK